MWRQISDWYKDGPIYNQIAFHGLMHVNPIVRKEYEGVKVYTLKILENPHCVTYNVSEQQYTEFNENLQVKLVVKFGSTHIGLIKLLREELMNKIFKKQSELEDSVRNYYIN